MDRDMVNCLHYLYQWGEITSDQLNGLPHRLFWCGPDTRYPLRDQGIVIEDNTGTLKLEPSVYSLIDMVEGQLRSMPNPDFAFGYPISAAIRQAGDVRPAFLAIPYAPEFEPVKIAITEAALESGFDCEVTGDLRSPGNVMDQVWQGIRRADAVVADITGGNVNVFYEIGLAHALGKEVIILSQERQVPFDIRHFRRINYEAVDLDFLKLELGRAFHETSARYPFEGNEPRF